MANLTEPQTVPAVAAVPLPQAVRRVWQARGVWLGLAAWGLALGGLGALAREEIRGLGWAALALAGLLGVIAWGARHPLPGLPTTPAGSGAGGWAGDRARAARFGGIALAALLIPAGWAAFLADPSAPFGLAGLLWLAGMAVLIAATTRWPDGPAPLAPLPTGAEPEGLDPTALRTSESQTAAPPVPGSLPVRRSHAAAPVYNAPIAVPASHQIPRSAFRTPQFAEALVVAGLVALAVLARVWDLQNWPYAIHPDEILIGRTAIDGYLSGHTAPFFGTLWENADLPAPWFLGVALSLKLGGITLAALRLPGALIGAATALPLYGLIRGAWGRAAAIAGTAIYAVSAGAVHYSRVTLNNIATPFFWAVCFFFLLRGLRTRRPLDWVLAGLAAGLGEYTYYGTRLLPFILLALLLYLLVVHWRQGWRTLGHFALLGLGYLAAFGPLLAYFITLRPELYFGRGTSMLLWDHSPRDAGDWQVMWGTLWPLFLKNLLAVNTIPSIDGVYWSPLLLAGEAALLVLGIALLIRQWRHPAAFLILLAGAGVLIVGGTLTRGTGAGPPFLAHWTPAFPAIYAAMAAPVGAWAGSWATMPRRGRWAGPVLVAALLLAIGWFNLQFYDQQYLQARPAFLVRTAQSRWEAALGPAYRVYTVGKTWQPYSAETNQYLVHGQEGAALLDPAHDLPLPPAPGKGLAFVFFRDNEQYLPLVQQLYPGGTGGPVQAGDGTLLFSTYVLTPEQTAQAGQ
jgi:4-amino-4-deoxy-L-arabinose transferase-like glycosyltransferase